VGPRVEAAVKKQGRTQLLKVDIKKWGSPVALQYKAQIGKGIPSVLLYDGKELIARGPGAVLKRLAKE
jgi:hypothetical protein